MESGSEADQARNRCGERRGGGREEDSRAEEKGAWLYLFPGIPCRVCTIHSASCRAVAVGYRVIYNMSSLRRKVKQGPVSFDVQSCSLIVNYELQEVSHMLDSTHALFYSPHTVSHDDIMNVNQVDVDENGRVCEVVRSKEKTYTGSNDRGFT